MRRCALSSSIGTGALPSGDGWGNATEPLASDASGNEQRSGFRTGRYAHGVPAPFFRESPDRQLGSPAPTSPRLRSPLTRSMRSLDRPE